AGTAAPPLASALPRTNALLGNLMPGQYGPVPNPGRTGASAAAGTLAGAAAPAASVGVGVPREAAKVPSSQVVHASSVETQNSNEQLARLISTTEAEVAQLPAGETEAQKQTYIEKQVYLRMLYLMSGQQERALQAIPAIEPADQEFWQQTFWGLANYFDAA